MIFKTIRTAALLSERGLKIEELIVGPSSAKPGAVQMAKNTYFGEEEVQALENLAKAGVEAVFQLLPGEAREIYRK